MSSFSRRLLRRAGRPFPGSAALAFLAISLGLFAQHPTPEPAARAELPNAPGKDVVQRLCGTCHSSNLVLGRGMTRDEWSEVVSSMISRGAKGSQSDFNQVIDYLAVNLPPKTTPGAAAAPAKRGGGFTMGPDDKQVVDPEAADRGKVTYNASCASCHGPEARGTAQGPDLVRSLALLHDRYGSTLGPVLRAGHPSAAFAASLSKTQLTDLSHFLHLQLENTLRSGPYSKVLNVLTGDPAAGKAYFNGAGKCGSCHSPSGDLAGIGTKYDPPTLQQRFLFPRSSGFSRGRMTTMQPVTITVTPAGGTPVSGTLDRIDDFTVSLRDSSGEYHSWKRTPDLQIEKHDPYAAHAALLDTYTDRDIHNLVAYLETLK